MPNLLVASNFRQRTVIFAALFFDERESLLDSKLNYLILIEGVLNKTKNMWYSPRAIICCSRIVKNTQCKGSIGLGKTGFAFGPLYLTIYVLKKNKKNRVKRYSYICLSSRSR